MRFLVAASILLVAGASHSDRYRRGLASFQERAFTSCHSVGQGTAAEPRRAQAIDLTRAVDHKTDAELRAFLKDPPARGDGARFEHAKLSALEIDDLVHFLHARAAPAKAPVAQPVKR